MKSIGLLIVCQHCRTPHHMVVHTNSDKVEHVLCPTCKHNMMRK